MWTFTTNLFYSAMQNSSKTWQRRWQKVDKSLKFMFEVSSLCTNTSSKSFVPLINSHVDSRLFKAAPNFDQLLLQFIDDVDFPLVYMTLHDSPDLVINWIEIWTVWRPQIWRNEVWCFSTQNLHSFTCTMCRCTVLLEDKILPWNTSNRWQQFLSKKNITIVCTVYFRAWIDEKQLRTAKFRDTDRWHCAASSTRSRQVHSLYEGQLCSSSLYFGDTRVIGRTAYFCCTPWPNSNLVYFYCAMLCYNCSICHRHVSACAV